MCTFFEKYLLKEWTNKYLITKPIPFSPRYSQILCVNRIFFLPLGYLIMLRNFFKINAYIQYCQGKEETSPTYPGSGNWASSSFWLYQRTFIVCLLVYDALLGTMQKILNQNAYLWLHLPLQLAGYWESQHGCR